MILEQIDFRTAARPGSSWLSGSRASRVEAADTNPPYLIERAQDRAARAEYRGLRRSVFVDEQGLFPRDDGDSVDADPRTVVLVARAPNGTVLGGVRLAPATAGVDLGWWHGGRLVVRRGRTGAAPGVGAALVRAACAYAIEAGVLRFEADVQARNEKFFSRLGWRRVRSTTLANAPHVRMRYPIDRISALAAATKQPLGALLAGMMPGGALGGAGFVGDDGAPVPGSDLVAACDAILPAMVERDPTWAGWCAVLVNVNDLAAMGARPVGLLDALAARDEAHAARVLEGVRAASKAWGIPVLGGHTTLGASGSLAVTALGRTAHPVPGGGGRPGHEITLTADLGGRWRPGYTGRQWDSTSSRSGADLRTMTAAVGTARPAAAKDVSMAGVVGTLGMLAEASGCSAVLDVAKLPRPDGATMGDWLTCFPGFAMLTTAEAGAPPLPAGPATGAVCGRLRDGTGVRLRWPDGEHTDAIGGPVTGMGTAGGSALKSNANGKPPEKDAPMKEAG